MNMCTWPFFDGGVSFVKNASNFEKTSLKPFLANVSYANNALWYLPMPDGYLFFHGGVSFATKFWKLRNHQLKFFGRLPKDIKLSKSYFFDGGVSFVKKYFEFWGDEFQAFRR